MSFTFSSVFKSFSGGEKSASVLGIDIGASSIKVVQVKKVNGKAVLETYGEVALGPYAGIELGRATFLGSEKLGEALKDLLRESNTTTVNAAMSISLGSSFVAFFRLPVTDENQVKEMIPLEARKYIPVPISEVTLDWLALPKDDSHASEFQNSQNPIEQKGTDILLVVIHNDSVAKNKDIEKIAGLDVGFSEVEIFSNIRASAEINLSSQMIIDFGASSTKAFIVERGLLKASHMINRGSQEITMSISKSMGISFDESEKIKRSQGISPTDAAASVLDVSTVTIDFILAEISRFMVGYEKKAGKKVTKIVLTGGGSALRGLLEKCVAAFETQIEIANPFSRMEYPAFLEEVLKSAGPEFSVAVGLAIRKLQEL